jgi:hypothetical protein
MKEDAMANEPRDDMRTIWQQQPVEPAPVALAELRRRSQWLQGAVRWRNLREYAGTTLAVAAFGYYLWRFPTPLTRAGAALTIAGLLYGIYQLRKRGATRNLPVEMAWRTCLEFHRQELQRQRDMLRRVWRHFLLPLSPGLGLFLLGMAVEQLRGRWLPSTAVAVICALAFFLVGKLNQAAADNLQQQIEALNALEREP